MAFRENADVEMMSHEYLKGTESQKSLPWSKTASRLQGAMTEMIINFRFIPFCCIG
jgi:hypothetical protein